MRDKMDILVKISFELNGKILYEGGIRGKFVHLFYLAIMNGKDPIKLLEFLAEIGENALNNPVTPRSLKDKLEYLTGINEIPTVH